MLLFPLLVAAVDGLARVRRRGSPVAAVAALARRGRAAVPARRAASRRVLGLTDVLPAPPGPVDPEAEPVDAAGLAAVALALVLGFLAAAARSGGCSGAPRRAALRARTRRGPAAALGARR